MGKKRVLHRLRGESGAAALEFAVVLPILLMILFGILEFGRIMMVSHVLTTTAREGVRQACLPGADTASVMMTIVNELNQAGLH